MRSSVRRDEISGLALIAVLVALSLLLALTGPFLLSMGHGDAVSIEKRDQKHVELVSASARDIVLHRASRTHESIDEHSSADDASEFPRTLELPEQFGSLAETESGRHLMAAETQDLQRRVNINTATPLVLANLLGLSTRLTEEHPAEADKISVRDASGFPDQGYLMIGRELIGYGAIDENSFVDLERGLLSGRGYTPMEDHVLPRNGLVLDYRVVLAVTHSFYHQGDDRRDRRIPLSSVEELARIEELGFGGFSAAEMDVLREHCTVASVRESEADFGMPQRVFEPIEVGATPWQGRTVRVRSASDLGGGTVLRIRSLDGEHVEYALCWMATEVGQGSVNLPRPWALHLVRPVARPFAQIDTVVEALLPHPVNVNTASEEVLAAIVHGLRSGTGARAHGDTGNRVFGRSEAEQVARQLRALRGDLEHAELLGEGVFAGAEPRPFESFEDLVGRFFKPQLLAVEASERGRWMRLYRVMRTGRPGDLEMGTLPVTFTSAPVVEYRAAAMRTRAGKTVARLERSGTAVAMPDMGLDLVLSTQRDFERRFRLDRQSPFYTTYPINMGSWIPFDPGTNPPSRAAAHVLPIAVPDLGFGQPRFPSDDGNADAFTLAPAHSPFSYSRNRVFNAQESMWSAYHPDGRDTAQEGPYEMHNSGPRAGAGEPPAPPRTGPRAHQPTFPYTVGGGLVAPHAVSFWFRPKDANDQMLFDLSADDSDRNRISIKIEANELVFEVLDEAGVDDDVVALQRVRTSPERAAGTWRVSLTDIDLQPETWYHVNLSAMGNRPGQLTLFVDGVPRGKPELQTTLTQSIQPYVPPATGGPFWNNSTKYLDIMVEDTEGFPERGVLRIGLELFEYTSKTGSSFSCQFARGDPVNNTMGGRVARMSLREYVPQIPINPSTGRPTINIEEITGGANILVAPPHEAGSTVELYGYSVPVYRDFTVQVGAGTLQSALGPFAVARVINDKTPITIPLPNGSGFPLGHGLDADEVVDIELGDPIAIADPQPATEPIYTAFSTTGGYALLMQVHLEWGAGQVPGQGNTEVVGGIELIRYGARNGSRLTGIQRGVKFGSSQPLTVNGETIFDGTSRKFVARWLPSRTIMGEPLEEFPQWLVYVVPISIPVTGAVMDPTVLGRSEFLQLFPRGGDEADTEWVRYDLVEGNQVIRSDSASWLQTWGNLTEAAVRRTTQGYNSNVTVENGLTRTPYPEVEQQGVGYIGYTEQVEVDFPGIQVARRALHFRGDSLTGTTSHGFAQGAPVHPVHRFELDWGNYGAMSGRTGRNDRVALVGGTEAAGTTRPPREWHTVNWSFRRFSVDQPPQGAQGSSVVTTNVEKLGAHYCQFVAFQDQVTQLFVGPAERNFLEDVRRVDRLVKFPSGELPAAPPENAVFGATPQRDVADFRGLVDELMVVQRRAVPVLLDEPFADQAGEFVVRRNMLVTPQGDVVVSGADYTAEYPEGGGLVLVGGEIIAYESRTGSGPGQARFKIAQNGRGLLDPERQAYNHDEGQLVYFLEQVPAAILSSGLSASGAEVVVNDTGNLPLHGGTLLVGGTELLHYTWSTGQQLLEMPVWFDPENRSTRGRGLFRGRYGTAPVSASAGEPVIWFPFRYWDRYHERAEDPELAYYQVSWSLAPVFFKSLYWQEEEVDALVDVHCLVRVDGLGSFAADPATQDGLFLFSDGYPSQAPNPINWQGSRFEARFMTVYKPGAFDPQTFVSNAWKKSAKVRAVVADYEGEGRILSERITAR